MLAGLFLAPLAFAKVSMNTIDGVAIVADHGRHIIATGPIRCNQRERTYLRVTVTQRQTGAMAEGSTVFTCTVDTQQWQVHAATQGKATFDDGPATAVAIARTADHGKITDAHQWLVNITLVGE
ncbi:MAG: hypothetical protein EXR70_04440 [Deltaproteobacteria bacterium]|nr:hypothetical protein [Deltaproteobacteria bacterium]